MLTRVDQKIEDKKIYGWEVWKSAKLFLRYNEGYFLDCVWELK